MFLDVQMPGLDGMGVIRKLREKDIPLPYFVMATAYDQYAVEAFKFEALDYLLKPLRRSACSKPSREPENASLTAKDGSSGATRAKTFAPADEIAGEKQPAELHRRCAGCGVRHH